MARGSEVHPEDEWMDLGGGFKVSSFTPWVDGKSKVLIVCIQPLDITPSTPPTFFRPPSQSIRRSHPPSPLAAWTSSPRNLSIKSRMSVLHPRGSIHSPVQLTPNYDDSLPAPLRAGVPHPSTPPRSGIRPPNARIIPPAPHNPSTILSPRPPPPSQIRPPRQIARPSSITPPRRTNTSNQSRPKASFMHAPPPPPKLPPKPAFRQSAPLRTARTSVPTPNEDPFAIHSSRVLRPAALDRKVSSRSRTAARTRSKSSLSSLSSSCAAGESNASYATSIISRTSNKLLKRGSEASRTSNDRSRSKRVGRGASITSQSVYSLCTTTVESQREMEWEKEELPALPTKDFEVERRSWEATRQYESRLAQRDTDRPRRHLDDLYTPIEELLSTPDGYRLEPLPSSPPLDDLFDIPPTDVNEDLMRHWQSFVTVGSPLMGDIRFPSPSTYRRQRTQAPFCPPLPSSPTPTWARSRGIKGLGRVDTQIASARTALKRLGSTDLRRPLTAALAISCSSTGWDDSRFELESHASPIASESEHSSESPKCERFEEYRHSRTSTARTSLSMEKLEALEEDLKLWTFELEEEEGGGMQGTAVGEGFEDEEDGEYVCVLDLMMDSDVEKEEEEERRPYEEEPRSLATTISSPPHSSFASLLVVPRKFESTSRSTSPDVSPRMPSRIPRPFSLPQPLSLLTTSPPMELRTRRKTSSGIAYLTETVEKSSRSLRREARDEPPPSWDRGPGMPERSGALKGPRGGKNNWARVRGASSIQA